METRLSSNVADLSEEQRKTVEALIGQSLRRDQVVFWAVMSPGAVPTDTNKARARAGLQELFGQVDRHIAINEIAPEEFEATVDEAVQHVRSQRPE